VVAVELISDGGARRTIPRGWVLLTLALAAWGLVALVGVAAWGLASILAG
jgi:hypothetical protein